MTTRPTLSLPTKGNAAPAPIVIPTAADIEKYLRDNGLMVTRAPEEGSALVPAITPDQTLHNPITSARPDLSKLPPPGERYSAPVQLPPRVWGQPRFLTGK